MHSVAEIVMPPTDDIAAAIKQVMEFFCDEEYDKEGNETGRKEHADWWDWFVIGGRFSGAKLEASVDSEKMEAFHAALKDAKVTVSGLVCGKQELSPASQIPMVDALWQKFFPGTTKACPLFQHARSQYGKEGVYHDDVCRVDEIPERLSCCRLIVANAAWNQETKKHDHPTEIRPVAMLATEFWNRVEHQETKFDGKVKGGVELIRTRDTHNRVPIGDKWLVVTVDYHN